MAKAKDIFKKFTVAAIATISIVLAGNSLQAQAETIKPEEMTLSSDVETSEDDNLYEESFGSIDELPDGSWIGNDSLLPEEAEENDKLDEAENMTQPSDAEDASDDATTLDETADNEHPQLDILMLTHQEMKPVVVVDAANATEATDEDDWLYADADDKELVPEFKGDSVVESKSTVNVDDDDDWMYVDFDSEPEVKGDDIITPEEPMVPEEPQPQPVVPETPILTEPTVQPMQTPVVLGDSLWTAPKTGDTLIMIAVCIIAALLAAEVIVLNLQRKRKKEERRRRTQFSQMIRPDHLIDH